MILSTSQISEYVSAVALFVDCHNGRIVMPAAIAAFATSLRSTLFIGLACSSALRMWLRFATAINTSGPCISATMLGWFASTVSSAGAWEVEFHAVAVFPRFRMLAKVPGSTRTGDALPFTISTGFGLAHRECARIACTPWADEAETCI